MATKKPAAKSKRQPVDRAKPGSAKARNKAAKKGAPKRPDVNVFIAEYKIDRNGRRAAIAAGYAPGSAAVTASRLLTKPNIRTEIDNHRQEVINRVQQETGITLERTLREIARGAFHDPRKFFDAAGNLLPVTKLDDDTAAALAGFEVTEEFEGSGEDRRPAGFTKKIKIGDRKGYLDMLMKHLGGYEVDNKQKAVVGSVSYIAHMPVRGKAA
jgi:phage terminase small subunit